VVPQAPAPPRAEPPAASPSGSGWTTPACNGFPVWPGAALKAAQDVGGREVTAGSRRFDPDPAAFQRLTRFLRARLPAALGAHASTTTCLYTLRPDRDLVLRPLPGHQRVLVGLGAAHGFKFAPLLGRLLADLAPHGGTEVDLDPFDPGRTALTAPTIEPNYLL
jgi:glycine/D-amino acid oxidase-like deaminating enzyme